MGPIIPKLFPEDQEPMKECVKKCSPQVCEEVAKSMKFMRVCFGLSALVVALGFGVGYLITCIKG